MSRLPQIISVSLLALSIGFSSTSLVYAESDQGRSAGDFAEVKHVMVNHLEASHGGDIRDKEGSHPGFLKPKDASDAAGFENKKQQFCTNHQQEITHRITNLVSLSQKLENTFDEIATKIENFYTSKVLPGGKTVSNYDSLVANIAANKTAVQSAITKAQADASSFTCTSTNPATSLKTFDQNMKNVRNALLAYKTSIKNLNVAVKSVNDLENKEQESSMSGRLRIKNASDSASESGEETSVNTQ